MMDNLPKRVGEHKERMYGNASAVRYTFDRLVYYEPAARDPRCVIPSVSEGPGGTGGAPLAHTDPSLTLGMTDWPRAKRVALLQAMDPNWDDLSARF